MTDPQPTSSPRPTRREAPAFRGVFRSPFPALAAALVLCLACDGKIRVNRTFTQPDGFGDLRLTTSTSGASTDGDGYSIGLEGPGVSVVQAIGANETVVVSTLPAGRYELSLGDLDGSCAAVDAPESVQLDSSSVLWVVFTVHCP